MKEEFDEQLVIWSKATILYCKNSLRLFNHWSRILMYTVSCGYYMSIMCAFESMLNGAFILLGERIRIL